MRILSVLYPLPFSPYSNDAMTWRVLNLRRILENEGHEVDLVYFGPTGLIDDRLRERIDTEYSYVPQVRELSRLKKAHYDLIFCNHVWSALNSSISTPSRSKSLLDLHGLPSEELRMNKMAGRKKDSLYIAGLDFITYSGVKLAGRVTCVSKRMMLHLNRKMKIPMDKMECVPNGVDLDFFSDRFSDQAGKLRESIGITNDLVFGYLGGFQVWQGHGSLIESANLLEDGSASILIVGGDQRYSGRNIQIVPKVSRDQIPLYYSACDVLVLPRPHHLATDVAAPTKFAEYAAMGKPIVTTNVGDARDYVTEYDCGIVIKDNSPSSLKQGMELMREMSTSELTQKGRNARKLAEQEFDWDKVGHKLSAFIG